MIWLLVGCVSPDPALALCALSPGLHEGPERAQILAHLLRPDVLAGMQSATPTAGEDRLTAVDRSRLEAETRCSLSHFDRRSGEIELERTRPAILEGGTLHGERHDTLRWTLRDGRVGWDHEQALSLRAQAQQEPDLEAAAELWVRTQRIVGDPTLDVDIALAEKAALQERTRLQVTNTFHLRQGQTVHAELVNNSDQDLGGAIVLIRYSEQAKAPKRPMAPPGVKLPLVPSQSGQQHQILGPVDAGGRLSYTFTLPPDVGRFSLTTQEVRLR